MGSCPDWLHRVDAEILRYLDRENPDYVPLIASRLGIHLGYAESRCETLAERGCIEPVSEEVVFRITERGERVLDGAEDRRETYTGDRLPN